MSDTALPKTVAYVALGGALSAPLSTRGVLAVALYAATALAGALLARRQVQAARRAGAADERLALEASERSAP